MFGMATTLFYAMYVIFGIPSNIMLGIIGARRWIAIIMVIWGIASTATMFATGPNSLYALRMLVGIAEAGFLPGLLLYLTYWFPAHYRARANALFMIAMPVTMALGSLVSGYILSMDGLMALKGWQWLFLLEGLPSVLLGVIVWFYLDDSPAKAKWLTEEDKTCLSAMMEKDRLNREQPERQHAESGLWRDVLTPTVMLYTVAYFCLCNTLSALSVWTPLILKSFNQDSSNIAIGLLSAVPHICTIAAMIWWSKRSDRLQERKRHTLLPYLFAAAGWILAAHGATGAMQLLGSSWPLPAHFRRWRYSGRPRIAPLACARAPWHRRNQRHGESGVCRQPAADRLAERYDGKLQSRFLSGGRVADTRSVDRGEDTHERQPTEREDLEPGIDDTV